MADYTIYPDVASLVDAAAGRFIEVAHKAIEVYGSFAVVLAGGSTPRALYRRLSGAPYNNQVDWNRVYLFWGDERSVPPDHPDSNYRMVRDTLLEGGLVPPANVYRIRGDMEPQQAAINYEQRLRNLFDGQPARQQQHGETTLIRFDLVLLGMGSDGHTASLFPGTTALRETQHMVAAHYVEKLGAWRITLTAPAINAAHNVLFFVSGDNKATTLQQVLQGAYQPDVLPAQFIRPEDGTLMWMVDAAAAAYLEQNP